jgi:DNA repair ATPase RecN
MLQIEIVTAILAALAGTLLPLTKEIVRLLRSNPHGEQFFSSSIGKGLLAALGLGAIAETPNQLFAELSQASQKLDGIVSRIQAYTKMRESTVSELEARLEKLSAQEGQLKATIEQLQQVPLPAAERFAELVKKEEKGGALRDYVLFVSGVVVSAIVSIVLKHYGIG